MKNILIVDDHPFILDAYETLIKDSENIDVKYIHKATSIEKAIYLINEYQIDVAILDISMPKNNTSKMEDGIDLAAYLKKIQPYAKIIFITMHMEFHILLKAIYFIKPEGFISKCDIEPNTFSSIQNSFKKNENFYSEEMNEVYKWLKNSMVKLDTYDFQILSLTHKGVKTKELIKYLPLSLSAIEKRKSNLKLTLADFNKICI